MEGAPSRIFIEHAAKIAERGGTHHERRRTLIAEAPKVGPHRDTMRAMLSEFSASRSTARVKAMTNETIGFVGRREGIAAIATATVVYQEIAQRACFPLISCPRPGHCQDIRGGGVDGVDGGKVLKR